jgi:putative transcriptional regulator
MPLHHPPEELLLDYAAGSLHEPAALVVATHLALCPDCRRRTRAFEAVGGELLETLPAVPTRGGVEAVLARLDEPEPAGPAAAALDDETRRLVPEPLRGYLGASLRDLAWRKVTRGFDQVELPLPRPGYATRLLRIRPGAALPRHTHGGSESVLVLDGGFSDERGHYARGDLALSDARVVHRPVADPDGDCLCLIVIEGPVKFAGALGRLLNMFVRY